ncbi:MAG: hypothetical protein BGO72_00740 [Burkholderiales bacterium 70-64]|nr:MAG: hypothetical protein BGO72_00740 [Burkholderiales bacterium 70-64]
MGAGTESDLARIRDADSCREWLRTLPPDPGDWLAAIAGLLARLMRPGPGADVLFEVLEPLRVAQVRAIEQWLAPLAARAVPYAEEEWHRVGVALANLRGTRDLFKRAYSQMLRADGGDTHAVIPGATNALRVVLPLARALDAQARIVSLLLGHRSAPLPADWDALCVLARHLRRTTFLDETLLDEVPLVKPVTARALFTYPLLLRLAALPLRPAADARFAERLASRLAARVGFRIDRAPAAANPHGPSLGLTPEHAVRLDTHRVPASLARRREQWLATGAHEAVRRQVPLTPAALAALLDDLERRWTAAAPVPAVARGARAAADAPPVQAPTQAQAQAAGALAGGPARLRFGLPRMHSADVRVKVGARTPQTGTRAPQAGAAPRYVYGRWEQNTIIRLALGTESEKLDHAALLMAEGETVSCLEARPDGCLVLERHEPMPRPGLGMLVAVAPAGEGTPLAGLSLGVVEAIEQVPETDYLRLRAHRITVRPWRGKPMPVGVKIGDAMFFEDAWLLPGDAPSGEPPSLVLAPSRAHAGARGLLREPDRDASVRFVALAARGPGYERLSLRIEAGELG